MDMLRYEIADGVATITLNRPEKLNAFNPDMLAAWADAYADARDNDAVRVVVVTGAGRAFCSGGDIEKMGADDSLTPKLAKENLQNTVQRVPKMLRTLDKPVIAAINGVATGAGLDMALMCDIRFAGASARLGETYARVGLVPGAGGTWFLPRLVGAAKALELFWGTDLLKADEALAIGLVNRVYPDAELMPKTLEFARKVASAPPISVRYIKRAVYQGLTIDLDTSLDLISSHMAVAKMSADHNEAVTAFREKRSGRFEGR